MPACFTRVRIATYVNDPALRPNRRATAVDEVAVGQGLANATLQQRLTPSRIYYGTWLRKASARTIRLAATATARLSRTTGLPARRSSFSYHSTICAQSVSGVFRASACRCGDHGLWLLDEAPRRSSGNLVSLPASL
jgi:hypothetical protein